MTLSTGSWWLIIPIKWPAFFLVGMAVAARGVGFLDSHDFSVARSRFENSIHTPSKQKRPQTVNHLFMKEIIFHICIYILHVVCSRVRNGLFLDCQQTCRFFLQPRHPSHPPVMPGEDRCEWNPYCISALPYEMFRGSFTLILTRYLECLGVVYVIFSYGMTAGCYVT